MLDKIASFKRDQAHMECLVTGECCLFLMMGSIGKRVIKYYQIQKLHSLDHHNLLLNVNAMMA